MILSTAERRELAPLLAAAVRQLPAGGFAERLAGLGERLESELDALDEESLALFIETLVHSRRLAGDGARSERLVGSIYRRTSRGGRLAEGVEEASEVLRSLEGQSLRATTLSLIAPGKYLLHLEAEGMELRIELGPRGVQASAAIGVT